MKKLLDYKTQLSACGYSILRVESIKSQLLTFIGGEKQNFKKIGNKIFSVKLKRISRLKVQYLD